MHGTMNIKKKKHYVSSPAVMFLRNLLSLPDISIISPEIAIRVSFIFGRQFPRYQMLTKAVHVQYVTKNIVTTSYRNSNLCRNLVYRFPSVTFSQSLPHN